MLKQALQYLERGWPIVPCAPNTKIARVKWTQYQERTPEPETVRTWFANPNNNIALITGKLSGIVVVDIDPRHGGTLEGHTPTLMVETPGGGWPTHTLGPGWREKLTADKPADKTTVDIEKQNIDKYANTELIAHLARAAARGEEVKLAFDFGSIGDTVKGYWEGLSPEARSSIIGGVGGLGIGALGGGLLGGGKGALIGALAGGGLGALGGRTYDPLLSYFKKLTGKEEEPSTPRQNTAQAKPRTDLQNYGPPGEYPQEMLDTMNANFPT